MGDQTRVQAAGMSNIGRTGGGGVPAWCAGLLMDAGAREPWNPGVVSSARACTLGCMTVASASLTEHTTPVLQSSGSGREKPKKKPYWIGLTHLGEDLPECGVYLGLLVLLIPGQLPLKLSPGLGNCLQLPQGWVEAELSLWAHVSMGVEGGSRDWQWYGGTNNGPHLSSPTELPWGMGWP